MKTLMSQNITNIWLLYLFITGGADFGKLFLVYKFVPVLNNNISYRNSCLDKLNVLLLALAGVAAVNIDEILIHSALHIPVGYFGRTLPCLRDKTKSSLRNKYAEIVIDEISMVSNNLLFNIHLRLAEIFGCQCNKPFPGLTGITSGDFFHLQPIRVRPFYMNYGDTWKNF